MGVAELCPSRMVNRSPFLSGGGGRAVYSLLAWFNWFLWFAVGGTRALVSCERVDGISTAGRTRRKVVWC